MCRAVRAGQRRQIQPTRSWLAAVTKGSLLAALVPQEVWGHVPLLAGRACLLLPAAAMSHQPPLEQASLVPIAWLQVGAALPADGRCPYWSPMLSTLPAWLAVRLVPDPAS